jgi:hypothetical protein
MLFISNPQNSQRRRNTDSLREGVLGFDEED